MLPFSSCREFKTRGRYGVTFNLHFWSNSHYDLNLIRMSLYWMRLLKKDLYIC